MHRDLSQASVSKAYKSVQKKVPESAIRYAAAAPGLKFGETNSVGQAVLPSSSVAGIDLNFYEAGYYRRICPQQF
jgi:hypothetical protein